MAAARPFLNTLERLRALKGEGAVAYPYGDVAFPVTERVKTVSRSASLLAFLVAEPNTVLFAGLVLVDQRELSGDSTHVEMYYRYEKLPGSLEYTPGHDAQGANIYTLRQRVVATTQPPIIGSTATVNGESGTVVQAEVEQDGTAAATLVVVYKVLSGPLISSYKPRSDGNLEVTTRQAVPDVTLPNMVAIAGVVRETIEGVSTAESIRTRTIIATSAGVPIAEDPGKTVSVTDGPTGSDIYITVRVRGLLDAFPDIDSEFTSSLGTGTVFDRDREEIDGSPNILQVLRALKLPLTRVENVKTTFTFPGIDTHGDIEIPNDWPGRAQFPWPGNGEDANTRNLLLPRSKELVGRLTTFYTRDRTDAIVRPWSVYTPGVLSRILKMGGNTIHRAIQVIETLDEPYSGSYAPYVGQSSFLVEDIDPSIPGNYSTRQIIAIDLGEEYYKGVWRHRILEVSEETPISQFPRVYATKAFKATSGEPLLGQPNPAGEKLTLFSDGTDTRTVTLYGKIVGPNGSAIAGSEDVVLASAVPVRTTNLYLAGVGETGFKHAHVNTPSGTRTVTIQGTGSLAYGIATAGASMAAGNNLQVGRSGFTRTYTAVAPGSGSIVCPAGAALVVGAAAASYVKAAIDAVVHYFWFSNGTTTDPAPGGTGHAVTFTGADSAATIAVALSEVMEAEGVLLAEPTTGTIAVVAVALGLLVFTQDAGADFGLPANSGTASAANQVRSTFDSAGVAMTATGQATVNEKAINLTGTIGVDYSTGTTIHADVSADRDVATLYLRDKIGYDPATTWVLSQGGTAFTLSAFEAGIAGPNIAIIGPTKSDAFDDIDFANTLLVQTGNQGDTNGVSVPGLGDLDKNLPGSLGLITSDALAVPTLSVIFVFIASGNPPLTITVEASPDGSTGWTASTTWTPAVTIKKIGQKQLYNYPVTLPAGTLFVRVKITNSNREGRAVHLAVVWAV